MRVVSTLISLGITGVLALGFMLVGTSEGNAAISDMKAAEAAICACDAGDIECGLDAQEQLESVVIRHMNDEVTDYQAQRFEASANRALGCRDRVFGMAFR